MKPGYKQSDKRAAWYPSGVYLVDQVVFPNGSLHSFGRVISQSRETISKKRGHWVYASINVDVPGLMRLASSA